MLFWVLSRPNPPTKQYQSKKDSPASLYMSYIYTNLHYPMINTRCIKQQATCFALQLNYYKIPIHTLQIELSYFSLHQQMQSQALPTKVEKVLGMLLQVLFQLWLSILYTLLSLLVSF